MTDTDILPAALSAAFAARALGFPVSPHFTLGELVHSDRAIAAKIDNWPADTAQPLLGGIAVMINLERLVERLLEPLRIAIATPLRVHSGYRCSALNSLVGGVADSQHLFGLAADISAEGIDNYALARRIELHTALVFDQLILEGHVAGEPGSGWVHVSIAPRDRAPRHQVLTMHQGKYEPGLINSYLA